jgi:cyanophycinase
MNGLIALVGAGEYLAVMDGVDRHLLSSARGNGRAPRVVCLPTAAGQEGPQSVDRWMKMGVEHFEALEAEVRALPIIDRQSADDPQYEQYLEDADLIYFSGGNPAYLLETVLGSRMWGAAEKAWARGAVYAGCSAGAMIMGKYVPNTRLAGMGRKDGLAIVPVEYIIPHFDHAGPFKHFVSLLRRGLQEGQLMLGLDEDTALVGTESGSWRVMGSGRVHLLTRREAQSFEVGQVVPIPTKGGK